jgi:hypothetical protein
MEAGISHGIIKIKMTEEKHQARRRCWTEICRKVDGASSSPDKKKKKVKTNPVLDSYSRTCFQLFIE